MFFRALTYDVFHLGLYMIAVLAWTTLCVMLLLKERRRAGSESACSCLYMGMLGAVVCLGLLLADVLRLVSDSVVLFGLVVLGVLVPGITAAVLYARLRARSENFTD